MSLPTVPRRRRPVRGASRSTVHAAGLAVAGCLLLVAPSGTWAAWSQTVTGQSARISAGAIVAEVAQAGPVTVPIADAAPGVQLVGASAHGIIPGIQGQEWTYQVTNASSSTVPAQPGLRIRTTTVGERYAVLRPYLRATVTTADGTVLAVPASAFTTEGIDHTVTLPGLLHPGQSTTAVLRVWVPGEQDGQPLVYTGRAARSSTVSAPTAVVTLGSMATLSQVAGAR